MNLLAFNRVLRTTLLMPVVLLGLLAGGLVWQIQEAKTGQDRVASENEIVQMLYQLKSGIVDEETGIRGYQLTGDRRMLEPYEREQAKVDARFASLKALLSTDAQRLRLAQVHDSYILWKGYAAPAALAGKQITSDAQLAMDLQAKARMDNLRLQMHDMTTVEQQSRDGLLMAARGRVRGFMRAVLLTGLAVGVLIGVFTSSRLRRVSHAYEETLQQLQTRADELYESRQSYMTTLESIGEGVIACDTSGRVRFMNALAQVLTGWALTDALDRPLAEVFRAVDEQTRLPLDGLAERVDTPEALETPLAPALLLARDEREIVISLSAAPIRDVSDRALGIVVVFRDISESRKAEKALVASERVAVMGRLAASIAHEIHNPLDSVATLHYLIKTEQDPRKRDDYLTLAQQELSRTVQISRAMLSLYRESQVPVEVKLPELIDSVLLLHDRKLKDAQITVERRYTSVGTIEAFPGEIRQVITNVVANAMEASGQGGTIRVSIGDSSVQNGEPACVVIVEDTGPGVKPEIRDKLFQPFFTTKGEKGTGLGLWVSRGIVQKHGGIMEIRDSVNRQLGGACIQIYLPEKFDGNLSATAASVTAEEGTSRTNVGA